MVLRNSTRNLKNNTQPQVIVIHRHGDRTPIASKVGVFEQTKELAEFWEGRLPARHRLSAWGAVDEDPSEIYLAKQASSTSGTLWPNGCNHSLLNMFFSQEPRSLSFNPSLTTTAAACFFRRRRGRRHRSRRPSDGARSGPAAQGVAPPPVHAACQRKSNGPWDERPYPTPSHTAHLPSTLPLSYPFPSWAYLYVLITPLPPACPSP